MKTDEVGTNSEPAKFRINSSYESFTNRQKSVFDQLNIAEHNTKNLLSQNNAPMDIEDPDSKDDLIEPSGREIKFKKFQGKESIFKKPQARPPRGMPQRKTPDYQIHPHKWTRYSLDDVKNEDMSDRANTAAAMSFLKEIQSRKSQNDDMVDDRDLPRKVTFKKSTRKAHDGVVKMGASTIFQNSKVVMPEYVVGQKIKKEHKRKEKKVGGCATSTSKEIKLGHLCEDDEEDNDN